MEDLEYILHHAEGVTEPTIDIVKGDGFSYVVASGLKEEANWEINPSDATISTVRITIPTKSYVIKVTPKKDSVSGKVTDGVGNILTFNL